MAIRAQISLLSRVGISSNHNPAVRGNTHNADPNLLLLSRP